MIQDEQIKRAVEETKHALEVMKKLKYYSYITTTNKTKYSVEKEYNVIRGVGLNFEQAHEILNKWNEKSEREGKPKLDCIAILEGDYARVGGRSQMVVPSKYSTALHKKYSREELYEYYKHICEVLNIQDP